jgi:hypothetical protein
MMRTNIVMAVALALAMTAFSPGAGATVTFIGTSMDPVEPHPDDSLAFSVQVDMNDTKNISKAYLIFCSVEDGVCYPQKEMRYVGEGNYSVDAGKFKEGEWKYNITMQLKDSNITWTPDVHFNVTKQTPGNGGGDNNNTTGGNGSAKDRTALYVVYGAVVSMVTITVVAAAVVVGQRRKGSGGP